ncbi:MAG: guanylate kinase [Selenomonadaceae bacterium]|nr:guanylate kinase [Selenomonadaceae bacterium]MBQ1915732.1 guanylate kinase [Selenomonadaceae bacterium]MBQ3971434.1 guanylate kinase [Selenomonadaceae bacterium]
MKQGLLIVVSGASGTGKGTVCNALMESLPELAYSISATTRSPRKGEQDGVNYYFLAREEFEKMIEEGGFLEWAEVYGNYYGTPLKKIQERLAEGQDILLEIDTQGALKVMEKCPEGVFIFLLPPSLEELERRIRGRGTETEESIARRLGAAKEEIGVGRKYKYVVVNDRVEKAVEQIQAILVAEHCRVEQNTKIFEVLEK